MLLELDSLCTEYALEDDGSRTLTAVDDVSFGIEEGQSFGLVGESGCGKSTIAKSIMRILPNNGSIADGNIYFKDRELTGLSGEQMRRTRWEEIALISQSAMNALDPVYTVGEQIREAVREHESSMDREETDARIAELFEMVGIDPDRMEDYPHQFSGGMKQRAMIAMALVLDPDLIIADEPTTALDVISQDTILYHLEKLQEETGAAMLLITHDMSVVAEVCDRTGVMYAGKLAELGPTDGVFEAPYHPYTLGLKNAFPSIRGDDDELISIPGSPPQLVNLDEQCRFAERCPFATDKCRQATPQLEPQAENHDTACIRIDEIGVDTLREKTSDRQTWQMEESVNDKAGTDESAPDTTKQT